MLFTGIACRAPPEWNCPEEEAYDKGVPWWFWWCKLFPPQLLHTRKSFASVYIVISISSCWWALVPVVDHLWHFTFFLSPLHSECEFSTQPLGLISFVWVVLYPFIDMTCSQCCCGVVKVKVKVIVPGFEDLQPTFWLSLHLKDTMTKTHAFVWFVMWFLRTLMWLLKVMCF